MIRELLPPLPTLTLAGAVAISGIAAPFMMAAPDVNALGRDVRSQNNAQTPLADGTLWVGPRAETKREILIAPLFAEDRKLPAPFDNTPPAMEVVEVAVPPEVAGLDTEGANPPEDLPVEPAPDEVVEIEEEQEPVEPSEPLVLPDLRLVGTFILESKGIARALLVETKDGAEETWVNENGFYEDWILTIVSPEAVRLVGGDESLTLEMWVEDESEVGETGDETSNDGSETGNKLTPE